MARLSWTFDVGRHPPHRGREVFGYLRQTTTKRTHSGEKMDTISESGEATFTVKPKHSWDRKMTAIKESGMRMAKRIRDEGHEFHVAILAPREIHDGDSVPLTAVVVDLDWKVATKMKLVASARDVISNAYLIESLDPALPIVLASIIEERGLYEHGIGEFFLLYGKFEQKYGSAGAQTRARMAELVNGNERYLKPYLERGKTRLDPLPYAVRNILSHVGNNPNSLDQEGKDLRTSIDLLRSWVGRESQESTYVRPPRRIRRESSVNPHRGEL